MLTKQEAFGKVPGQRTAAQREPGEGLCHVAHSLVFYGDGISSGLSLANPSESGVLPGMVLASTQPKWLPARRLLGGW